MEILGIGPGEFILILIVLLVVVGPERLPTLARQAGQMLVRGRNWLQSSPDAAMVMRARQEIEQELANLKTSLLEVQSVRDEVLGAAKQIGAEVNSLTSVAKAEVGALTSATQAELDQIGSIAPPKLAAPAEQAPAVPELAPAGSQPDLELTRLDELDPNPPPEIGSASAIAGPPPDLEVTPLAELDASPAPELAVNPLAELEANLASVHPAYTPPSNGAAAPAADGEPIPTLRQPRQPLPEPAALGGTTAVFESIDLRLQAIMTDLFALQEQLKRRGVLDGDWQPPSWGMQLPAEPDHTPAAEPEPAAPADTSIPVETEEAPNVQ